MEKLNLNPNLYSADDFYSELLAIHESRSKEDSDTINARLILILANHIGDRDVLKQALQLASETTS